MLFRVTATLKGGNVLEVEFADRETMEAELRFIERLRRYRWGLPDIFWQTVTGERWCFGVYDIVDGPEAREVQPEAVAS